MKNILLSILGLCIAVFHLSAQSGFEKGYVINSNNDTIWGFIKQGSNISSTTRCIFKTHPDAEVRTYEPTDLKSYRITDGKYFVSRSVTVNDQPRQLFLEYLVQGLVHIFLYVDTDGIHYLIDKGDGNLLELKNTISQNEENGLTYSHERKEYAGILAYVFQDSPKTSAEAMTKNLDYKSLIELAVDYHKDKCAGDKCIIYEKKADIIKLHFGLVVGVNYNTLTKGKADDRETFFQNTQFNSCISPTFGAFIEVKLPYVNNDRLYARYDASFWQEKHTGSNEYQIAYTHYTNNLTDSKFNLLNSLLLKLDLNKGKVRCFAEAGGFIKAALHSDFTRTLTIQQLTDNSFTSSFRGISEFHQMEVGPIAGLGIKTKINNQRNIALELRYLWGSGVTGDQHFNSNRLSLNLGIQLF